MWKTLASYSQVRTFVGYSNLKTMKTQKELHETAIKLLKMIKKAESERTEMLKYNLREGVDPFKNEELTFKCQVIARLQRSYNNVLKELVTKSMER